MHMQVPDILRNKLVQMTTLAVATFAGGVSLGYILGKRRGGTIPRVVLLHGPNTLRTPVDLQMATVDVEQLREGEVIVTETTTTITETIEVEVDEPESVHVFVNDNTDWDDDVERSQRTKEEPYIIHQEEFVADDMGYHQETLTYYAGDDIMADVEDTPIYNYQGLMGELRFGHGSKDPGVVYIRNETLHMEWEILHHEGTFEQEVLGLKADTEADEELQHSHQVPKFRQE